MLQKIFRDDITAGAFLNKRIKGSLYDYKRGISYRYGEPIKLAIAYTDEQELQHGTQAYISVACAKDFVFSRKIMKEALAIFFKNDNNIRLQALTPSKNKQARRLLKLSGFTEEGVLRSFAKDDDAIIASLLRMEFIKKYGQPI